MRKEVVVVVCTTLTVVAVGALLRRWKRRKEQQLRQTRNIIRKLARDCATPVTMLWQVADDLVSKMKASLVSSNEESTLNMIISNVTSLPNGEEEGFFYGVNLQGKNLLMLCARLGGKNMPISGLHREEISIPDVVLDGTSQEIIDFVATEIAKFVSAPHENEDGASAKKKKLGFTLSYPVDKAVPFTVTTFQRKSANDPVNKGLVKDLNRALKNHGIKMHVFALVDDTIGGLAGGRYYNRDSVAAVTLGMTTNAAYVESEQEVSTELAHSPNSNELVISIKWGDFKSPHLPVTAFDASLDAESSNPGSEIFEKLISGMYLGEIVRRVLLKMAQETALFGCTVPPKLMTPYLLRSPDMAAMHQDTSEDREVVSEKLKEVFGITSSSAMAREVVAEVCDIVTERGARLAGAGIVGIIKKLGRIENRKSVVTVEGGLYEHYRIFRNYLHSSIWEMLGNDLSDNVIIEHSHGGSGTGALFLAAAQSHTHRADS
ncbi:probable hexokinase-like 2 protein [Gastrolobium bilobum]|uniref:probable hexokinase-like 2 protein n=1 Tax=Gastrolobium bilobum TaxID=150636 RepID=UPI002AB2EC29|nr:probable hexokinase-like 2 protein [Gastrolobium bilobum]